LRVRKLFTLAAAATLGAACAVGEEPAKRPDWDQKKAVEKVQAVLAVEEKGDLPWDQIAWETDPKTAAGRAEKERKPVFVYFYLKKSVGPASAPC
jgi:hypothetical protein